MKKIVVRIFNILFIAAAAVAVFSFATKPLVSLEVSATIKKEKIGELAANFAGDDDEGGGDHSGDNGQGGQGQSDDQNQDSGGQSENPETYLVRLPNRDGGSSDEEQFNLKDALSETKVADAVGDITLVVPIEISAAQCFDLKNEKVFNEILENNIKPVIDSVISTVSPKFKNLVKSVTMDFAKDVMKTQIQDQINKNFGDESGFAVTDEQVNKVVEDIYATLNKDGENQTTTVSELSEAILGRSFVLAEGVTAETFGTKTYYILNEDKYEKATEFNPEAIYYQEQFDSGVCGILKDIQNQQEQEGKEVTQINFDEINMADIEDQMVNALDSIPNLTSRNVADPQPTEETFGAGVYYVKNEMGCYDVASKYEENVTYYGDQVLINSIDDALIGLLDMLAGQTSTPPVQNGTGDDSQSQTNGEGDGNPDTVPEQQEAILRKAAPLAVKAEGEEGEASTDRVSEKVKTVIYKLVPFDKFLEQDLSLNGLAPVILFGLVFLGMLPWLFFILVSLIRTIRPRKCWTKTWIILVFAFLQVIFGVGLTYGIKFATPLLMPLLKNSEIGSYIADPSIVLKTSALIPSFIYLAFIPASIIFAIVRHSVVRDFKQYKRDKKEAKKQAKLAKRAA